MPYLAELTGWRAAAVDSVAFEVEQRVPHGIPLPVHVLVRVGVAVREGGRGRRGGLLERRAGQTQKVGGLDQKGLQSYVSRHLGENAGVIKRVRKVKMRTASKEGSVGRWGGGEDRGIYFTFLYYSFLY